MRSKSTKDNSQVQLDWGQSPESKQRDSEKLTSLLSDFRARICQLLESERVLPVVEAVYSLKQRGLFGTLSPLLLSLKMSQGYSPVTTEKTLKSYCERLPTLGYMSASGNCLILPGFCPKIVSGFTLSDILEKEVDEKYFLSEKMVSGLMRPSGGGLEVQTAQCLSARMAKMGRDDNYIHQLNSPKHSNDRIYGQGGASPALNTMQGGNRQPKILCVAQRGRENGQQLEQRDDAEDKTNTLTSVAKDNYIVCQS